MQKQSWGCPCVRNHGVNGAGSLRYTQGQYAKSVPRAGPLAPPHAAGVEGPLPRHRAAGDGAIAPGAGLHLARLLRVPAQSRAGSRFVVDVDAC